MSSRISTIPVLKVGLTERELLSVVAAYLSLRDGEAVIDWNKFIQLAGYSSIQSARICFRPVQKKLRAFTDSGCGQGGSSDSAVERINSSETANVDAMLKTPKTPKTPGSKSRGRPKKRKLENDEDSTTRGIDSSIPIFARATDMLDVTPLKKVKTEAEDLADVEARMRESLGVDVEAQAETADQVSYFSQDQSFGSTEADDSLSFGMQHYEDLGLVSLEED